MTDLKKLEALIALTPNWPEKGVLFRDISPLLAQRFDDVTQAMLDLFDKDALENVDAFAGIDARGFVFASAMAAKTGKNMVMVRKGGKLPPPSFRQSCSLEYGEAVLEIKGGNGGKIILVDDVLATGGTLYTAAELCAKAGYDIIGIAALINLKALNQFKWRDIECRAIFEYS